MASNVYAAPGVYRVNVLVDDGDGGMSTSFTTVTVLAATPGSADSGDSQGDDDNQGDDDAQGVLGDGSPACSPMNANVQYRQPFGRAAGMFKGMIR